MTLLVRRLSMAPTTPHGSRDVLICDKGYAGREFAGAAADLGVVVVRPARRIK